MKGAFGTLSLDPPVGCLWFLPCGGCGLVTPAARAPGAQRPARTRGVSCRECAVRRGAAVL